MARAAFEEISSAGDLFLTYRSVDRARGHALLRRGSVAVPGWGRFHLPGQAAPGSI